MIVAFFALTHCLDAFSACENLFGRGPSLGGRYPVSPSLYRKLDIEVTPGSLVNAIAISYARNSQIETFIENSMSLMANSPPRAKQRWLIFDGLLKSNSDLDKIKVAELSPDPPGVHEVLMPKGEDGVLTVLALEQAPNGKWTSSNRYAVYRGYNWQITIGYVESLPPNHGPLKEYPTSFNLCGTPNTAAFDVVSFGG